jgi:plastocyanin
VTTVYIDGVANITAIPSGSVITGLSDGEHEISITAEDPVENIGADMVAFTIDTTPPSVHILSPTPKTYNQDSVILSYTLSDGTVTIYLDNIANITALASGSILSDLSEGSHNLTFVAMDTLGNIGYTEVIFSIDTIAPLVIIDSPSATTYTTNEIPISLLGEAMQYWYSILGVDPENLTWTSEVHRLLVDGVYTLNAYGSDSAGNVGKASFSFSIDTIAPMITHLSEVTYEEGTNTFLISWSPYDENPSHYSVMQNDQVVVEEDWNGETIPFDVGGLACGIHFFVCNVYDKFGHTISDTIVVIVIDTTSPYIYQPIDLTFEEGTLGQTITWTATDTNPFCYFIKRNDLVVDGGEAWDGEAISTNLDGLEKGVYTYTCIVYDTEGNQANDSIIVTVIDTTAPFIDHPNNLIYVEGVTANNITWHPFDNHPSSYTITMNGTQIDAGSWNGNSITISFEDLGPGNYTFICTVFDEAGNSVNDSVLVQVPQNAARGSSWPAFSFSLIAVCLMVLLRRVKKNP